MSILIILGILGGCFLMFGLNAGLLAFWVIVRWPLVIILGILGPLLNIIPDWYTYVALGLAIIPEENVPDWVWDWLTAIFLISLCLGALILLMYFAEITGRY